MPRAAVLGNVMIDIIHTEAGYESAVKRIEELTGAWPNMSKGAELDVLMTLVKQFEAVHQSKKKAVSVLEVNVTRYVEPTDAVWPDEEDNLQEGMKPSGEKYGKSNEDR